MKTKYLKKIATVTLALVMVLTMQITVFAASISKTNSGGWTIGLQSGAEGDSNTITYSFSNAPSNAKATTVKLEATYLQHIGTDAIVAEYVVITAPSGEMHIIPWGSGNTTTTTLFTGEKVKGDWQAYMIGKSYPSTGSIGYSYTVYKPVKLTITYVTS